MNTVATKNMTKSQKYRAKLKSDPEKWKNYLDKHNAQEAERRKKNADLPREPSSIEKKQYERERKQRYRQKLKKQQEHAPFKNKQTRGKALKRALRVLQGI